MTVAATMRAAYIAAPTRHQIMNVPIPDPGPGQVLIEVKSCGVCRTELAAWTTADPNGRRRLGHEPSGIVVAVGAGTPVVKTGDRVTGRVFQSYAEYVVADQADLCILPDNVPFSLGLGEPLGCLVEAERRTQTPLGARVAVVGLGFMGLGFLELLSARGAGTIVAIDPRRDVRDVATANWADEAYHPDDVPSAYMIADFAQPGPNDAFDVVVEASGTQAGLDLATVLTRIEGTLSILGFHQGGTRTADVALWNWKVLTVVNAHARSREDIARSTRAGLVLMAKGAFSFAPLVSHHYSLDNVDEAFVALRDKPLGFVKAVIDVDGH